MKTSKWVSLFCFTAVGVFGSVSNAGSTSRHPLKIEQGMWYYMRAPQEVLADVQVRIQKEVERVCPPSATWRQVAHLKIEIKGQGDLNVGPLRAIHYPTYKVSGEIHCR